MPFLPICRQDMIDRGWEQCDFVYVIGDAYVDHHILFANGKKRHMHTSERTYFYHYSRKRTEKIV